MIVYHIVYYSDYYDVFVTLIQCNACVIDTCK